MLRRMISPLHPDGFKFVLVGAAATLALFLLWVPAGWIAAILIVAVLLFVLYLDGIQITQAWVQQGRIGFVTGAWLTHMAAFSLMVLLFVRRVYLQRWLPRWAHPGYWLRHRS